MILLALLVAADAFAGVSEDWSIYRVGARDCRMRNVDPVSRVITYGSSDCTPLVRTRKVTRPVLTATLPGISARIEQDNAPSASAPTAGLTKLFPGPSTLRIYRGDELMAETMGTPRAIVGMAEHAGTLVVVFTYEKEKGVLATDALGVRLTKIAPAALAKIHAQAKAEHSDALVIVERGHVVLEDYFGGKADDAIFAMSASKSITALALMQLVRERKIPSLEVSASDYIPAWKADGRKAITLRHLLSHVSGLDPERAAVKKMTIAKRAEETVLQTPPGTQFKYNNNAVDILSLVVRAAAGKPMDQYQQERLFKPLGVHARWMNDADGNARAAGELEITPRDLIKIGQALLDDELFSAAEVKTLMTPQPLSPECGLLWWLKGSKPHAWVAAGWLGQFLVIVPEHGLIAVRMRHLVPEDETREETYGYRTFAKDILALVP